MDDVRQRFTGRAYSLLAGARLEDLLQFLSVRKFAAGSNNARFYQAFPRGRDEALALMRADATTPNRGGAKSATTDTIAAVVLLVSGLKARDAAALDKLRRAALEEFDRSFSPKGAQYHRQFLRTLMCAVAQNDADAQEEVSRFNESVTADYVALYGVILDAIGREPKRAIGSVRALAVAMGALYDGLGMRARIGDADEVRLLLSDAMIHAFLGLTRPVEARSDPGVNGALAEGSSRAEARLTRVVLQTIVGLAT